MFNDLLAMTTPNKKWKEGYTPTVEQLASWLRLSRLLLSMTQSEMARALDMSVADWAAYEHARKVLDAETRQAVMEGIGLQLVCLFEGDESS